MKHFNPYILSLLKEEGKFSCVKTANSLPLVSHDFLTRFLVKSNLKVHQNLKKLPSGGDLIFDDTIIPKKYSKNIENCSYVYSSSDKKIVLGLCFILVIYVCRGKLYILDILIWRKGGPTKNELIRNYLTTLKSNNLKPSLVIFDRWYNASETLNLLESFNWKYISLCRNNRKFENKEIKSHKFYGAKSLYGKVKKVKHTVQIIKHSDQYIITNLKMPLNSVQAWKLYGKRWFIETIFRDLKSFLHLNQCSSRSLKAQRNHFICCLEAYLYLRKKYPNKSIEAAHQEFLHKFRNLKPKQINALLQTA